MVLARQQQTSQFVIKIDAGRYTQYVNIHLLEFVAWRSVDYNGMNEEEEEEEAKVGQTIVIFICRQPPFPHKFLRNYAL